MEIGMPTLDSRYGERLGMESCFPCQNHFGVGFRRGASLFRRGIWNPMPNPMPKQIWRGIWKSAWDSALDLEIGVGFGVAFMFRRGIRRGILISAWDGTIPCQNSAWKTLWGPGASRGVPGRPGASRGAPGRPGRHRDAPGRHRGVPATPRDAPGRTTDLTCRTPRDAKRRPQDGSRPPIPHHPVLGFRCGRASKFALNRCPGLTKYTPDRFPHMLWSLPCVTLEFCIPLRTSFKIIPQPPATTSEAESS